MNYPDNSVRVAFPEESQQDRAVRITFPDDTDRQGQQSRKDEIGLMVMRPFHRNFMFFVCSMIVLCPVGFLFYRIIDALLHINDPEEPVAFYTQLSVAILFVLVSVLTPILSLRRLYRHKIHCLYEKPSFWTLFRVRNPFREQYRQCAIRIYNMLIKSYSYASGEEVCWDNIDYLREEDKEYIKMLVEENIMIKKREDGSVYAVEYCSYLLVFVHLLLLLTILLAGVFSTQEFLDKKDVDFDDRQFGRVLAEWMSNYVLLIIGFIQIVSKGAWINAFSGFCSGASSTMSPGQMNSVIACYIVSTKQPVEGLRREFCYSKVHMNGSTWESPPVNTAVIASAAAGHMFSVDYARDGRWIVNWNSSKPGDRSNLVIRTVGSIGSSPSL